MNLTLTPAPLRGEIAALPSKSQAHRMLICAALGTGPARIECRPAGQDIDATVRCLRALGAQIAFDGTGYAVAPIGAGTSPARLDVGESGSTLRFLLPVACALGGEAEFILHGRLAERPLEPLWSELLAHGAALSRKAERIFASGPLRGRDFRLDAGISSQFLSGILFALARLGGGTLTLEGRLESAAYLELTLAALRRFGVKAEWRTAQELSVLGALTSPGAVAVEGDWSNAAFWLCAGAMGSDLAVTGLDAHSAQGDRAVVEAIAAIRSGGARIDCRQIPDLVPPLAVLAGAQAGTTAFVNAARLRLKESDRIASCAAMLRALGAAVEEFPDGFTVHGAGGFRSATIDSANDHRIAMAAAIAATRADGPVTILGAQAVEKSYAAFWADYARLGGQLREATQ